MGQIFATIALTEKSENLLYEVGSYGMSNEATRKWAEEQRELEETKKWGNSPRCLHCSAPIPNDGSALCDACD